jgi:hypothetical protein
MEKIKIEQHSFPGAIWFIGWLFTIGYLNLSFGKGVLALALLPRQHDPVGCSLVCPPKEFFRRGILIFE